MTTIEKLEQMLDITITEEYPHGYPDLEIGEYDTADGYSLHVITTDGGNPQFETDVFYYEPDIDTIMDRITALPKLSLVWISDFEMYMPDHAVEDWINDNADIDSEDRI